MAPRHILRLTTACLLSLGAGACLKVPHESASLTAMEAAEVTASELQMRVYEAGRRFSWIIESAADTIAKRTEEPEVRRRALRWKIVVIPLVEEASLRADPVVAAVDLWGLSMQQSDFLTTGAGRDFFGDLQPIAIAAADTLEGIAGAVVGRMRAEGHARVQEETNLREWARRHPIEGSSLGRESILSSNWEVLGITETSLTGTMASVQRSLTGVTNRLGYLNEGIFKRVLWQSELVAHDLTPMLVTGSRVAMDSIFVGQQGRLFSAVTEQRVATFASIAHERAAVLEGIRGERGEVLDRIAAERIAVLDAIMTERRAVLDAVRAERIAALAAADSIAQRSIEHAFAAAGRLLLWIFVGLVVLAIAGGLGAVLAIRTLRS
jgi:hypothetical protein